MAVGIRERPNDQLESRLNSVRVRVLVRSCVHVDSSAAVALWTALVNPLNPHGNCA